MTSDEATNDPLADRLQAKAKRHLWMHFTRLGAFAERPIPIFVRGSGVRLFDANGRSFLDALAGLFVVQVGHGRTELAEVAARQAEQLAYYPIWSAAHPAAIELAARLADLAPGDLNRVFFTTGGSEAVESAWKLARAYFRAIGQPERTKVIARDLAYHGTTMGALAVTGLPLIKDQFEPLVPGASHVVNTNRFRSPFPADVERDDERFAAACADAIEAEILAQGPETVAAVFLEPLQNTGGCFPPPPGYFAKVRQICDRHGVLLVSDEVICGFGRLGAWFGAQRYDFQPDMITFAKGVTSGYSPLGGVICRDFLAEPFLAPEATYAHGITFGGHPVSCAVGLANLDLMEREDILEHVAQSSASLISRLQGLRDLPIVGDVRGDGFFWAIEMVKDGDDHSVRFTPEERRELVRTVVAPGLFEAGLICRADDRVDPVIQLSPVLLCDEDEFDEIETTLRAVLMEATKFLAHQS
ncbi:MAG TPA: aspartate aminotransferase family protein [Acidimicrobiales bacterium]|nr:aspartate aminotransferase family protein [Acidimicrobiales bacterium]